MAARKANTNRRKTTKRKPRKVAGRQRPDVSSRKQDIEVMPLGVASGVCDEVIWKEMLIEFPRLREADRSAAEDYCQTVADLQWLRAELKATGALLPDPKSGGLKKNPLLSTIASLLTHQLHLIKEFGGTPKARAVKARQKTTQAAVPGEAPVDFFDGDEG